MENKNMEEILSEFGKITEKMDKEINAIDDEIIYETKRKENKKAKKSYIDIAISIAKLVEEKQKAYGNSFERATRIFEILYPDGIKIEQYQNVLVVARILDKLSRIATDEKAFGENPWEDIAGYSILMNKID